MKHVAISSKYGNGGVAMSAQVKSLLEELGYSVHDPNSLIAHEQERWLLVLQQALKEISSTKGFMLQIQSGSGTERAITHMQKAEDMMCEAMGVPRVGLWTYPEDPNLKHKIRQVIGLAERQWSSGFSPDVQCEFQAEVARREAEEADKIYVISTPYQDEALSNLAAKTKKQHDTNPKIYVFNPNQDMGLMGEQLGWSKEETDKKWGEIFMEMLLIAKDKNKSPCTCRSGGCSCRSLVLVMARGIPPNPRYAGHPQIVGNAQPQEIKAALGMDFNTENGTLQFLMP